MKRLFVSILTLGLLLPACRFIQPAPDPAPSPTAEARSAAWSDRSIFRAGLAASAQPILEALPGASVYHLDLTLAEDLFNITGSQRVYYTNTEDLALTEVQFRLFPNILGGSMDVLETKVDGQRVDTRLSLADSLLHVPLVPALTPGKTVAIQIEYTVSVPQDLDLNYGVLAYAGQVLALAHAYPMIAVFDDEGWNAEIPSQSGDLTYADMSFYLVRVTAPKEVTLVATGREVGRTQADHSQVVTFAAGPARDFYLAASPQYELYTRQSGEVAIRFFAPSKQAAGAEGGLRIAASALENFSARYSAYPYTELDLVATPTRALGIEYPGMIAITGHLIDAGDSYLEGTITHEVAHQWFYNLVGNDQLDDPWLDESLAQWATLQYFSDEYGAQAADGFRAGLTGSWEDANGKLIPIGLPVAEYTPGQYGNIVYGRGPLFFEALREELGARTFDAFLHEYVATHAWSIATPESLQLSAEQACGRDLAGLFNEWVYP